MLHTTPVYVQGKENHVVGDCSTNGDSTSGGAITGSIIDLQAFPKRFTHAQPVIAGTLPGATSTVGGTRFSLQIKLQHGASSGGGDMADLSTDLIADVQPYFSTAQTTDLPSWTTNNIRFQYSPTAFALMQSHRFIRPVGIINRIGLSTSTAAGNLATCHLGVNLMRADVEDSTKRLAFVPGGDIGQRVTTATAT